jgi:membrane protease subunit HflC
MRPKYIALLVVVLGGLLLVSGALFTVHQTKYAIVMQFGEAMRVVKEPGLAFKIPIVQNVVYYDNRTLDLDPPPFEVLLTDKKWVVIDAYARYRIVDPLQFFRRVKTELVLRDRFGRIINSSLRRVIATVPLSDVLSDKRDDIMSQIQQAVTSQAESFGIKVVDLRIGRTEYPDKTRESVFDRMRTERQREARELRAEGNEEAQKIRAKADMEKTILLADAERTSQILRGQGEGGRNRILGEAFSKDPEFFDFYKSLAEYQKNLVDSDMTMVLSPDSEFFRYFGSLDRRGKSPKR